MELDTDQENILIRAITPETIRLINIALSGNVRIIKKEFKDLYNSLYGRKFRKQELLDIFNDWLKTETEKDEEIIYDIASLDDNAETAILPAMLLDEISKVGYNLPAEYQDSAWSLDTEQLQKAKNSIQTILSSWSSQTESV